MTEAETEPKERVRPKIGVYALTSCYGCQLLMATVQPIVQITEAFDIKSYHMVTSAGSEDEPVDIAFVEGSVSTDKDLEDLLAIRRNSKILVAMGACAVHGGVQSWAEGEMSYDELYAKVYGDAKIDMKGVQAAPISQYVHVDYSLPGCPPEEDELLYYLTTLLVGTFPEEKDYPVCAECRTTGNPCILIESGVPCLGAVTTAGCKGRCITFNVPCVGCRGAVPFNTAWFDALARVLLEKGYSEDVIRARLKIFSGHNKQLDKMLAKVFRGEDA